MGPTPFPGLTIGPAFVGREIITEQRRHTATIAGDGSKDAFVVVAGVGGADVAIVTFLVQFTAVGNVQTSHVKTQIERAVVVVAAIGIRQAATVNHHETAHFADARADVVCTHVVVIAVVTRQTTILDG